MMFGLSPDLELATRNLEAPECQGRLAVNKVVTFAARGGGWGCWVRVRDGGRRELGVLIWDVSV